MDDWSLRTDPPEAAAALTVQALPRGRIDGPLKHSLGSMDS